ncbi:hypothetical protein BH11MYX1_BH11MYX1_32860 [soil metagenome]
MRAGWGLTLTAIASGCFRPSPLPPTLGYGAPYKGTGEGIYAKDSRGDWDVTEGQHKITSEQALEATGDPEYEARRQIAKAYNARLYVLAEDHHVRAHHLMEASGVAIAIGYITGFLIAPALQTKTDVPATLGMPEMQTFKSGFTTDVVATIGVGLLIAGIAGIPYAYYAGSRPPPYHVWRTPDPLNRAAYVHQQTEPYNEKVGAPSIPDEQTGKQPASSKLHLPPGVRPGRPPPHIPHPRGAR